jgi:drug/metabolite transporter (DMT)-like permease
VLSKRRLRRVAAIFLAVLGGVLMYLAPGDMVGLVLLVLGVTVEVLGIALERKA